MTIKREATSSHGGMRFRLRRLRHLSQSETARRMGMSRRAYEHWEQGAAVVAGLDRLLRFAEVTDTDPWAILAAQLFDAPQIAIDCADNRLGTVLLALLADLHETLGSDLQLVERRAAIGLARRLAVECRKLVVPPDLEAEQWLARRLPRI